MLTARGVPGTRPDAERASGITDLAAAEFAALAEHQRGIFERLEQLARVSPGHADRFASAVLTHIRTLQSESVRSLGEHTATIGGVP